VIVIASVIASISGRLKQQLFWTAKNCDSIEVAISRYYHNYLPLPIAAIKYQRKDALQ